MQYAEVFDGQKVKSTSKEGLGLGDEDKKLEQLHGETEPQTMLMQEVLGDKVEKVIASDGLGDLPSVVI